MNYLIIIDLKTVLKWKIFTFFFLLNIFVFVSHIIFIYITVDDKNFVQVLKMIILTRFFRVLVLLNKFKEFFVVFKVIRSIKYILSALISCQFTFFYLYSTITMLILGGKINEDSYKNDNKIPNYYFYINFNDLGSSFITCFALMMLNNINISIDSLSSNIGLSFKFYFILFYMIAIMLLLNICHTFILDMYIKHKEYNIKNESREKDKSMQLNKVVKDKFSISNNMKNSILSKEK